MLSNASVRVIPNGIDLDVFQPGDRRLARAALDLPQDAMLLLFVGSVATEGTGVYKDFAAIEAAMPNVASAVEGSVQLLSVGTPLPSSPRSGLIRYLGPERDRKRLALYYQAADLHLHAARGENFPYVILEAMACGLPTVATSVGGIPEQVRDGATGFLVPPGNAARLAERTVHLLLDDGLRASFSRRALEIARCNFGIEMQVDAYLGWYGEIFEERYASLPLPSHPALEGRSATTIRREE
jgi:glycosyltransferase involved in cell wall biosynthesis